MKVNNKNYIDIKTEKKTYYFDIEYDSIKFNKKIKWFVHLVHSGIGTHLDFFGKPLKTLLLENDFVGLSLSFDEIIIDEKAKTTPTFGIEYYSDDTSFDEEFELSFLNLKEIDYSFMFFRRDKHSDILNHLIKNKDRTFKRQRLNYKDITCDYVDESTMFLSFGIAPLESIKKMRICVKIKKIKIQN